MPDCSLLGAEVTGDGVEGDGVGVGGLDDVQHSLLGGLGEDGGLGGDWAIRRLVGWKVSVLSRTRGHKAASVRWLLLC